MQYRLHVWKEVDAGMQLDGVASVLWSTVDAL